MITIDRNTPEISIMPKNLTEVFFDGKSNQYKYAFYEDLSPLILSSATRFTLKLYKPNQYSSPFATYDTDNSPQLIGMVATMNTSISPNAVNEVTFTINSALGISGLFHVELIVYMPGYNYGRVLTHPKWNYDRLFFNFT